MKQAKDRSVVRCPQGNRVGRQAARTSHRARRAAPRKAVLLFYAIPIFTARSFNCRLSRSGVLFPRRFPVALTELGWTAAVAQMPRETHHPTAEELVLSLRDEPPLAPQPRSPLLADGHSAYRTKVPARANSNLAAYLASKRDWGLALPRSQRLASVGKYKGHLCKALSYVPHEYLPVQVMASTCTVLLQE